MYIYIYQGYPIGYKYGIYNVYIYLYLYTYIYTYIWLIFMVNLGICHIYMDPVGTYLDPQGYTTKNIRSNHIVRTFEWIHFVI